MKLNFLTIALAASTAVGCQSINTNSTHPGDTVSMVGADKDAHGCISSAGYTWSQLENNCIRIWEKGIPLHPLHTSSNSEKSIFILLDSLEKKAEVFLTDQETSIILKKDSTGVLTNGEFNLLRDSTLWTLSLKKTKLYQSMN